jgi:hypothetical protein
VLLLLITLFVTAPPQAGSWPTLADVLRDADVREQNGAIVFAVTTQRMRLTADQQPEPAGAKESFRVACAASGRPACRRQE